MRKNTKLNLIGNFFFRCSVKKTDKWELDGILKTRGSFELYCSPEPVSLIRACIAHPSLYPSPKLVSLTPACIARPSLYRSPKPVSLTSVCIAHPRLYCLSGYSWTLCVQEKWSFWEKFAFYCYFLCYYLYLPMSYNIQK